MVWLRRARFISEEPMDLDRVMFDPGPAELGLCGNLPLPELMPYPLVSLESEALDLGLSLALPGLCSLLLLEPVLPPDMGLSLALDGLCGLAIPEAEPPASLELSWSWNVISLILLERWRLGTLVLPPSSS